MTQKNFRLVTFLILFYILLNHYPVHSYNITTHNENEIGLQVFNTLCHRDGTLVVYMVKPTNETCIESGFRVRVIYPNGTTEINTRTYPIPEFCLCKFTLADVFPMRIYRYSPKYAILAYVNSTDRNLSADNGILLSTNGELIR